MSEEEFVNINENEFYEPVPDDLEDVEDEVYQVSQKGLERLTEWARFQVQLWETSGAPVDAEEFSEIPFLVGFLIPEVCYYRGIPVPGMEGNDDS